MDIRTEGLPFSGDECWDAFVDPAVQEVLVPWREVIDRHSTPHIREWLPAFPIVAYAVVRNLAVGEKSPRWAPDSLYQLAPQLASQLLVNVTAFKQASPSEWGIDRLIIACSGEYIGHVGGPGTWDFRTLTHGEIARRLVEITGRFQHLTPDYVKDRYFKIRRKQKTLWRDWSNGIEAFPGFSLPSIEFWLRQAKHPLKSFIAEHKGELKGLGI